MISSLSSRPKKHFESKAPVRQIAIGKMISKESIFVYKRRSAHIPRILASRADVFFRYSVRRCIIIIELRILKTTVPSLDRRPVPAPGHFSQSKFKIAQTLPYHTFHRVSFLHGEIDDTDRHRCWLLHRRHSSRHRRAGETARETPLCTSGGHRARRCHRRL